MKITNKNGLPGPIYDLIKNDEYSRGDADISVTQLIDSPRVRVLYARHDQEIEQEASSFLAATLGRAFHSSVEKATTSGFAEKRMEIMVHGWKLSGGIDHHAHGVITDYKTANIWKTVYSSGGRITGYEKQLNVYAHILRENGIPVHGLKVFILFKDWNKRGFYDHTKKNAIWKPWKKAGYPEKDWAYIDIPLWEAPTAKTYVETKILAHQEAQNNLPLCSWDDIWEGSRCEKYCAVNKFCDQYQKQRATGLMEK